MQKVSGNFEAALLQMIQELSKAKDAKAPYGVEVMLFASSLLADWDRTRGTDWFTRTREGVTINERLD